MAVLTDVFELALLSAMLKDETVFKKASGMVSVHMFSSSLAADVYEVVVEYYKGYSQLPQKQELTHLYSKCKSVVNADSPLPKFLDLLYSQQVNSAFIINELSEYVRLRELEILFRQSYEQVKSGGGLDVSEVVNNIFRIQRTTLQQSHLYGVSVDEAEYILEQGAQRRCIPTNIEYLNEQLGGGLYNGQLGVILAPPNYGKTMLLLNFAVYAWAKALNNVLFVTLEMPEFSILRRIMMLLSGCLQMPVSTDTLKMVTDGTGKKFNILYRPVKSISTEYLYSVYHQALADGVKFDVVFIDYADLLLSPTKQKEKRFELADIFSSLKSFAQVIDIPVWSATQANREGMKSELVTMAHLSESMDKGFISDVIVSLSDKMEQDKVSKLYLTKNREGKSNVIIDAYVNQEMYCGDNEVDPIVNIGNIA